MQRTKWGLTESLEDDWDLVANISLIHNRKSQKKVLSLSQNHSEVEYLTSISLGNSKIEHIIAQGTNYTELTEL